MARERDDDYEDDADERPARRTKSSQLSGDLGPLDKMYRDTNIAILIIFGVCCSCIASILSAVAYFTAKDPKAKSNALIVMVVGIVMFIVWNVLNFALGLAGGANK